MNSSCAPDSGFLLIPTIISSWWWSAWMPPQGRGVWFYCQHLCNALVDALSVSSRFPFPSSSFPILPSLFPAALFAPSLLPLLSSCCSPGHLFVFVSHLLCVSVSLKLNKQRAFVFLYYDDDFLWHSCKGVGIPPLPSSPSLFFSPAVFLHVTTVI